MHSRPVTFARVRRGVLVAASGLIFGLVLGPTLGCAKSAPEPSAPAPAPDAASAAPSTDDVPAIEWNAERMTQLTGDLSKAMRAVRNSFRNDPVLQTPDSAKRRSANQMMDILRNLDRNCSSLATQVQRGGTADDTRGTARRIGMLLRDANQVGRRLMTNAWTDEKILPAMKLINEIAPYYGRGPLYDTETMTLIDGGPNPNRRGQGE